MADTAVARTPQRPYVERQLFGARQSLTHLVEMYESGQWQRFYASETAFADAVRKAREAFDHWTETLENIDQR